MPILWTQKLSVGVEQIDEEHRELFDRVNRLLDAMSKARAREELAPLVGFLSDYVTVHFGAEQALMHAHRYPEAAAHQAEHAWFVTEFRALAAELQRTGPSALLGIKLNTLLCEWLRDHVSTTDRTFGRFLQTVGATARA